MELRCEGSREETRRVRRTCPDPRGCLECCRTVLRRSRGKVESGKRKAQSEIARIVPPSPAGYGGQAASSILGASSERRVQGPNARPKFGGRSSLHKPTLS